MKVLTTEKTTCTGFKHQTLSGQWGPLESRQDTQDCQPGQYRERSGREREGEMKERPKGRGGEERRERGEEARGGEKFSRFKGKFKVILCYRKKCDICLNLRGAGSVTS